MFIACRRTGCCPTAATPTRSPAPACTACSPPPSPPPATPANYASTPTPARSGIDAYQQLAQPQPGIAGQITARAEAHTIRLALIYALVDRATQIDAEHLTAALALQDYAARSAGWALDRRDRRPARRTDPRRPHRQPRRPDPQPDQRHPQRTTSPPANSTQHSAPSAAGRATATQIATGGRPAELWTAAPAALKDLLLLSYPTPRCRPTTALPCRISAALNTLRPPAPTTVKPSRLPSIDETDDGSCALTEDDYAPKLIALKHAEQGKRASKSGSSA